jgi:tetrahydromethanopterin S-methyltransferase subunit E
MRAYVTTTGVIFGLLALVHIWRAVVEGPHLATDPWYVLITLIAAGLCLWAWRVLRGSPRV